MLTIKLQRIGKKHQPSYRLMVQEKREKLDGRVLEDLGWYNNRTDKFELNKERVAHWLKMGAQKTDTVHNLLITAGIIEGKKIAVHKKPKVKEGEAAKPAAAAAPAVEAKPAEASAKASATAEAAPAEPAS